MSLNYGVRIPKNGIKLFVDGANQRGYTAGGVDLTTNFNYVNEVAPWSGASADLRRSFCMSPNGQYLFTIGLSGVGTMYKYTLSTPYDITTATLSQSISANNTDILMYVNSNFLYLRNSTGIYQFNFGTAYDLNTISPGTGSANYDYYWYSSTATLSFNGVSYYPLASRGFGFTPDGLHVFADGSNGSYAVGIVYKLNNPFDLSSVDSIAYVNNTQGYDWGTFNSDPTTRLYYGSYGTPVVPTDNDFTKFLHFGKATTVTGDPYRVITTSDTPYKVDNILQNVDFTDGTTNTTYTNGTSVWCDDGALRIMALDGAYNLKCFKFTVANQLVDLLSTAKAYSQGSTNDVTWDGYTYSFNNSYINLGDSLQGIGNYATISLWFRSNLSGASDYAVFVGWGDGNSNYSSVGIGNWYGSAADESIHIGLNSATLIADYRGGHSLYHDQQWHHAVFTMGPNNYRIYVDGEPKPITYNNGSSSTSTGDIFSFGNSNVETWIGGRPYGGGSGYFNGRIGNIAIYDRILSEIEVSKLFEAHRGRFGV